MQIGTEWVLIALNRGADTEGQTCYDAVNISYHREWIAGLGVDGIEPPESRPPPAPTLPSAPESRPRGRITPTFETESLTGLTCTFRTSDGACTRVSGNNSRSSVSWNLAGPFRRSITVECE